MAAKNITYAEDAPPGDPARRQQARRRRQGHPRPQGPQRRPREEVRLPAVHQGRRHRREGDRAQGPAREHGRPARPRGRVSKTSDVAGDGTTTATVLAQAIFREGLKTVTAGANPMDLKRGIEKAVETAVERDQEALAAGRRQGDRPGRHASPPTTTTTIGEIIAEAMEKVGKDGVITVEEAKRPRDLARGRRGDAVRPRLPLALLRHRPRADGSRPRGRLHPDPREEDLHHEGPAPAARAGREVGQAARDHRRGRRGRGAGDAGRQQAARHAPRRRGQGARASATAARRCSRTSRS